MNSVIFSILCSAESERSEAIFGLKSKYKIVNINGRSSASNFESKGQFTNTFFSKSESSSVVILF